MNQKTFTFALLSIFVSILAISFVSALTIPAAPTIDVGYSTTSAPFTFAIGTNSTETGTIDLSSSGTSASGISAITFTPNSPTSAITGTATFAATTNAFVGSYSATILAALTSNPADNVTSTLTVNKHFCKAGENGSLSIDEVSFSSTGSDETAWKPFDQITIKVHVTNNGADSVRRVYVKLGLFDSLGRNKITSLNFISADSEKTEIGTIDSDNTETAEFQFIVPADFTKEGNYKLAVKAYSDSLGESASCSDTSGDLDNKFYQSIGIDRESENGKLLAIDDSSLNLSSSQATPGDTDTLSFKVYNVGIDSQSKVKVVIKNAALGINEERVFSDMSAGDGQDVQLSFIVPQLANGKYPITIDTFYDYRSSDGTYRLTSDKQWSTTLQVIGGSVVSATGFVDVTADPSLNSQVKKAGTQTTATITFKNTGTSAATFIVGAKDFESWGTLSSISERIFSLNAGQSKNVQFVFGINADASGDKTFTVETTSGTNTDDRTVALSITANSSFWDSLFQGNSLVWVIVGLNVVLIVLIIIVAVALSRR